VNEKSDKDGFLAGQDNLSFKGQEFDAFGQVDSKIDAASENEQTLNLSTRTLPKDIAKRTRPQSTANVKKGPKRKRVIPKY